MELVSFFPKNLDVQAVDRQALVELFSYTRCFCRKMTLPFQKLSAFLEVLNFHRLAPVAMGLVALIHV